MGELWARCKGYEPLRDLIAKAMGTSSPSQKKGVLKEFKETLRLFLKDPSFRSKADVSDNPFSSRLSRRAFLVQSVAALSATPLGAGAKALEQPHGPRLPLLGEKILEMENPFGVVNGDLEKVRELCSSAHESIEKKRVSSRQEALETLTKVSEFLKSRRFRDGDNRLLRDGVRSGMLDCDLYCFLFLSIAEEIGLPLCAVKVPVKRTAGEHMFIRWDLPSGDHVNWETLKGGSEKSDEFYIKECDIHPQCIENGVYLRPLSREETISSHAITLGDELAKSKEMTRGALNMYRRALITNPKEPRAHYNMALVLGRIESRSAESKEHLARAMALNPHLSDPLFPNGT
jgi:tetratricopeptide (TPR) repeat protein